MRDEVERLRKTIADALPNLRDSVTVFAEYDQYEMVGAMKITIASLRAALGET